MLEFSPRVAASGAAAVSELSVVSEPSDVCKLGGLSDMWPFSRERSSSSAETATAPKSRVPAWAVPVSEMAASEMTASAVPAAEITASGEVSDMTTSWKRWKRLGECGNHSIGGSFKHGYMLQRGKPMWVIWTSVVFGWWVRFATSKGNSIVSSLVAQRVSSPTKAASTFELPEGTS